MIAPSRVFIAHAGADWECVVQPVATGLQANSFDVVTANWDDHHGESLVHRIVEEELPRSQAIVIVLSPASAGTSWVREELDDAAVLRITGNIRLILLHVDECPVPTPLQHVRKVSMHRALATANLLQVVIDELATHLHLPPLNAPSGRTGDRPPRGLKPVDWTLLTMLGDMAWNQQGDWMPVKDVYDRTSALGLTDDQTTRTLDRLASRGLVQGRKYTFGKHYASLKFTPAGASRYCRAAYPGFDRWKTRFATQIATHPAEEHFDLRPEDDIPSLVFRTAIDELLTAKLVRGYWFPGVNLVRIMERTPNLRKWLDRQ